MNSEINAWLKKAEEVKKGVMDLSRDEDLSIAIMNLVSLEEHFYFTAMKTSDEKYLEMLETVRKLRIKMLEKMVSQPQGEEWCISKHLLASSMRLMEVGTKELSMKKKKETMESFTSSFELYSLFFAINLKVIEPKKIDMKAASSPSKNITSRFSEMVKKIVDCCKEW